MSKAFLSLLFFVGFIFLSVFISTPAFAQEKDSTISAKLKSGGSYELFWPLTSGRTIEDNLYFLKLWKESIGGLLIFNSGKKADYEVTLATKRVLEAEKLLKEGKEELAAKTLNNALAQLTLARGKFSKATKAGNEFQIIRENLQNQLSNLEGFIPNISQGNTKSSGEKIQAVVKEFLNDVRGL